MVDLTQYKNFWLIWLSCAGTEEGQSLFSIQRLWDIKTNYLYHNERGLGRPLFKAMIEAGYLEKQEKKLIGTTEWIPHYVLERHSMSMKDNWTPNNLVIEKWPLIQRFIEKNREFLFDIEQIKLLYRDIHSVKKRGEFIFDDIFLIILASSITPFARRYKADIVIRIINTVLALSSREGLIDYYMSMNKARLLFPSIISSEQELKHVLCPVLE